MNAEAIDLSFKTRFQAMLKLTKLTLPALPWITGYYYLKSFIKKAKMYAKDHETDVKQGLESGKYKDFNPEKKSKVAFEDIRKLNRLQCLQLFN